MNGRLRLTAIGPIIIVVVLMIAFGSLSAMITRLGEQNSRQTVRAFSRPIVNASSSLLFNPLYSLNVVQLRRILAQYTDGDAIISAAVYDRRGQRVAQISGKWRPDEGTGEKMALEAIRQNGQVELEIDDYFLLSNPIAAGNQAIGAVVFAFDQGVVLAAFEETQRQMVFFTVLAMLATAILFFFLIRFALTPLAKLAEAAQQIGAGNLDVPVPINGSREIAMLAQSLESMRSELLKGYTAIQDLMAALEQRVSDRTAVAEKARADAEAAQKKLEGQMWLAHGQVRLADAMRGEQTSAQLAENILACLCEYLGAQAGALYLLRGDTLSLDGRYALAERAEGRMDFTLGEGLVGEAARSGSPLILRDIPDSATVISTNLLEIKPRQTLVFPFYDNNKVAGVIELATLGDFDSKVLEFLNRVSEIIGMGFNTVQTRQRLLNLLDETRRQAEELQTQEEELRAANEELQAQAENLRARI